MRLGGSGGRVGRVAAGAVAVLVAAALLVPVGAVGAQQAAGLSGLSVSPGQLHPSVFVASDKDYEAWVPFSVESVRVTATGRSGSEALTVNGRAVVSGQPSHEVALDVGANLVTVAAVAAGQQAADSYTITVTRASEAESGDASLGGISVYLATSDQPDNAGDVGYEGDPLALSPTVSAAGRKYSVEAPENGGSYVAVAVATAAPGAKSIAVSGTRAPGEARPPKASVVSGEASGPWYVKVGYSLIEVVVTSLDGTGSETYRLIVERGSVDDPAGLRLAPGDGSLTLRWDASESPTAPTHYMLRWRKAGESEWLNRAGFSKFRTSHAAGAPFATAADGESMVDAGDGAKTLGGLDNGTAYEVQVRAARLLEFGADSVIDWLTSGWQSLTATPGAAKATLAITPANAARVYGGADDLGYTVSGLADGDAPGDVVTGALSRAPGDDVGTYAISMGTLAIASAYAGKYQLPAAPATAAYEITPRTIPAVSGVIVVSRDADGTTAATFDTSAAEGTDVLAGELADFRGGGLVVTGQFPSAAAGTHSLAVTYALQDSGAFKAANYNLTHTSAALQGELTAVEAQPACAAAVGGDYDRDDDGLIEVCDLGQLNAIRFDDNGDGVPLKGTAHEYTRAFPGIVSDGPGCPAGGCDGYELVADLDFDTNANGQADAGDEFWNDGLGWEAIPIIDRAYTGDFEGNGHTIANLYISRPMRTWRMGLFGKIGAGGEIRNVKLADARILGGCDNVGALVAVVEDGGLVRNSHVTGEVRPAPLVSYRVGLLAGVNRGRIQDSSAAGTVTADRIVGILVGYNRGDVVNSTASGRVSGHTKVGGLIGETDRPRSVVSGSSAQAVVTGLSKNGVQAAHIGGLMGWNNGSIRASMARATVLGQVRAAGGLVGTHDGGCCVPGKVIASYAWGRVAADRGSKDLGGLVGNHIGPGLVRASYSTVQVADGGGLVGRADSSSRVVDSYWDTDASGAATSAAGQGLTTAAMVAPTGYTGVYADWNVDLDGDGAADDPWRFDAAPYPILRRLGDSGVAAPSTAILLTADAVPAMETADDLALTAVSLPSGTTISPALSADADAYTITVPPDREQVTLFGRFDAGIGTGAAWLAAAADLSGFDAFDAQAVKDNLLAQLSGGESGSYPVNLDNGESKTLQIGVYKWRTGEANQAPFGDHTHKRIYTLTLARADYPDDDASLTDLSASPGKIGFAPDVLSYHLNTASTVNTVTVSARAYDPEATVTVAGHPADQPVQLNLDPGANTIAVVVTARDGTTTKTYQITVRRAYETKMRFTAVVDVTQDTTDDMRITGLAIPDGYTISPAFSPDHYEYQMTAPTSVDQIEVFGRYTTPYRTDIPGIPANNHVAYIFASSSEEQAVADYQVWRKGNKNGGVKRVHASGSWAWAPPGFLEALHRKYRDGLFFDLEPGQPTDIALVLFKWKQGRVFRNPVKDNSARTAYTFTVTRALPADDEAGLGRLKSTAGPVALVLGQTDYALRVGRGVDSVTMTPTPLHPSATVTVNGGPAADPVDLDYGANPVSVVVTAADGTTTETYTITITRARPDPPPVPSRLELEVGLGTVTATWHAPRLTWQADWDLVEFYEIRVRDGQGQDVETRKLDVDNSKDRSELGAHYTFGVPAGKIGEFTGLTDGADYTFAVRAGNVGGTSDWLETAVTMPAPTELSDLEIHWYEVDDYLSGFSYQRGTESYQLAAHADRERVLITPSVFHPQATVTMEGQDGRLEDDPYQRAVRDLEVGANTIEIVVSVPGHTPRTYTVVITRPEPPKPSAPRGVRVATTETSITVLWAPAVANTNQIDSWQVELIEHVGDESSTRVGTRQSSSGASDSFTRDGDKLRHTFTGLNPGGTYTVRIRAVSPSGAGTWTTSRTTLPLVAVLRSIELQALTRTGDSGVQLAETFAKRRTSYTVDLPHEVLGLRVKAHARHPGTAKVNGKSAKSNGNIVNLRRGKINDIKITVTEGAHTKTYNIAATVAGDADAPTVASSLADVSGLEPGDTRQVSLAGVFADPNGDALTITAATSDNSIATVAVAADYSSVTVTAVAAGTAAVTVTADDGNGGTVSDRFDVSVNQPHKYADLISRMYQWRNDPNRPSTKQRTDPWDRALLAFGKSVADQTLTPMTAAQAQAFADQGWTRWVEVAAALTDIEQQQNSVNSAPTVASALADVSGLEAGDTRQVSLAGVFADPDGDALTVTAATSDSGVATVAVAADHTSLTVTAVAAGAATITVTAGDGNRGTVTDTFTVTVANSAPALASALADISGLKAGDTRQVQVALADLFTDPDGDALTVTAVTSNSAAATVAVAASGSFLTVTVAAVAAGAATITVTADDGNGGTVSDAFTVAVANSAPTVASALADISGLKAGDTRQVSLAGVFTDPDGDALTVTAATSDSAAATVAVAADYSSLTVTAVAAWAATITVTADDGNGGTVSDAFIVGNYAPTVASALADVSGLEAGDTRKVSLAGVFADYDGDALTVTAATSDSGVATVAVAADHTSLTVTAVAAGTATVTVTADDGKGGTVSDAFDVSVAEPQTLQQKYAGLISRMYQWRNDPNRPNTKQRTDLWDRALLAFGETVADETLTAMTAAQAQAYADRGWTRWVEVADALADIESQQQPQEQTSQPQLQQGPANSAPTVASALADVSGLEAGDTRQVSLAGVFADADGDALTVTAASSDSGAATVSVAADYSSVTVTAVAAGTATVTVTAADGSGGTVSDTFDVTVAADASANSKPVVVSALADVSGLKVGEARKVSLAGVFSDRDGDRLAFRAKSSDSSVATVSVAYDGTAMITVTAKRAGTATITVNAHDGHGAASDAFTVTVTAADTATGSQAPDSEPEEKDPVKRYDANGNGRIEYSEYMTAYGDFLGGALSIGDLLKVRAAFTS